MRSLVYTSVFGALLAGFLCGCVTCGKISYSGRAPTSPPSDISIIADQRDRLGISLASRTRDARKVTILSEESVLTDARGRKFRLEFRPNDFSNNLLRESPPGEYASMVAYDVRAYGPLPKTSEYSFAGGEYTISVAYTEDGDHRVVQTTFVIHWRLKSFLSPLFWSD